MNRFGRLLIAAGLPLLALVGFALATNRGEIPPDRGQTLLNTYLSRIADIGQSARVVQTVPALRPFRFTREMSDYSLGYGVYYQTTDVVQRPQPAATRAPDPLATLYPRNESTPAVTYYPAGSGSGGRALRFPPDYASCILIERGAKFEVVVVAEHHDTWNADWVLHTSTLSPQKLIETLGCDLNLPQ
jgi:hypothetical protein